MQCFPLFMHLKKAPTRSSVIIHCELDLGSFDKKPHRNQAERFLYENTIFRKNQPEVSLADLRGKSFKIA